MIAASSTLIAGTLGCAGVGLALVGAGLRSGTRAPASEGGGMPVAVRLCSAWGGLVGEVSPRARAAVVARRRALVLATVLLVPSLLLSTWVLIELTARTAKPSHEVTYTVAAILPVQPTAHPYGVVSTDGHSFFFEKPTGLVPGATFSARYDSVGRLLGTTLAGRYSPSPNSRPNRALTWWSLAILGLSVLMIVYVGAWLVAALWWAQRNLRALDADAGQVPIAVAGTYLGSRVPRSLLLLGPPRTNQIGRVAVGFPVAIRDELGRTRWFSAPLREAARIKEFETRLRDGNRAVTVRAWPATGAIVEIRSGRGDRIEVGDDPDGILFETTAGIPLPFR